MSDTDTPSQVINHPIHDPNNEPVKFVSMLGNSGFVNGVVNLTFLTARYRQTALAHSAQPDLILAALLRMDLRCAIDLRDALSAIIDDNTDQPRAN